MFKKLSHPLALVAILSLLWGSEWLVNMQLGDLPRLRVIAFRCLLAAIFLVPFAVQKTGRQRPIAYGRNILLGLGMIAIPVLLGSLAVTISSGLSVVLFALVPLIATLLEGDSGLAGSPYMLGGLLGVAFLVRGSLSFSVSQGLGILWISLAAFCVAASMVKAGPWLQTQNLAGAIMVQMLSAAATIGVYSLLHERSSGSWPLSQRLLLCLLGIVGSALAYAILYTLLRTLRASQVAVFHWITPVVGVLEAALWVRHAPSLEKAAGALLAIACAAMMLRARPRGSATVPDELAPLTLKITLL